jgi:hypothetical protein
VRGFALCAALRSDGGRPVDTLGFAEATPPNMRLSQPSHSPLPEADCASSPPRVMPVFNGAVVWRKFVMAPGRTWSSILRLMGSARSIREMVCKR